MSRIFLFAAILIVSFGMTPALAIAGCGGGGSVDFGFEQEVSESRDIRGSLEAVKRTFFTDMSTPELALKDIKSSVATLLVDGALKVMYGDALGTAPEPVQALQAFMGPFGALLTPIREADEADDVPK
jgi:hypothetical protein